MGASAATPTTAAPRGLNAVQGQDAAITTLRRAVTSGRLAHTYLFEGPSGVGKQIAALGLAAAALCDKAIQGECGCDICRRIYTEQHPDVRVIRPRDEGGRNLKVQFVREEILPFTQFAPFEARAAFLIFPDADVSFPTHQQDSANAMLKTLEEPRPNVHFVFLSSRPDRLLATVRSRSQRVRFRALPSDLLDSILAARDIPADTRGAAVSLASGQADRALELCTEGLGEQLLDLALRLDDALQQSSPGALLDLSDELARSDDLNIRLSALALFYRDLSALALGAPSDTLGYRHAETSLTERAARANSEQHARRVQRIHETMEQLQRNANPELALNAMLFGLA